jgi:hypothetical protein
MDPWTQDTGLSIESDVISIWNFQKSKTIACFMCANRYLFSFFITNKAILLKTNIVLFLIEYIMYIVLFKLL